VHSRRCWTERERGWRRSPATSAVRRRVCTRSGCCCPWRWPVHCPPPVPLASQSHCRSWSRRTISCCRPGWPSPRPGCSHVDPWRSGRPGFRPITRRFRTGGGRRWRRLSPSRSRVGLRSDGSSRPGQHCSLRSGPGSASPSRRGTATRSGSGTGRARSRRGSRTPCTSWDDAWTEGRPSRPRSSRRPRRLPGRPATYWRTPPVGSAS